MRGSTRALLTTLLSVIWAGSALSAEEQGEPESGDQPTAPAEDDTSAPAEGPDDSSEAQEPTPSEGLAEVPEDPSGDEDPGAEGAADEATTEALLARVSSLESRLEEHEARLPPIQRSGPQLDVAMGGRLQSDLRFRIQEKSVGAWYNPLVLPVGISRAETLVKAKATASFGKFRGVTDIDFVLLHEPNSPEGLEALSSRQAINPYRFEAHALYVQASDLIVPGLDLRIGQQLVLWGVGDQFNPTNNLNADDLEDPLLFGEQQANLMLRLDYSPWPLWTFSGVLVPLFKPAMLPGSSSLGLAAIDRLPFTDPNFRYKVHAESALSEELLSLPTVVSSVTPELPPAHPENMQFMVRVAGAVGMQDLALSYYRGRSDFPQPHMNASTLDSTPACEFDPPVPHLRTEDVGEDEECIDGLIRTDTYLAYPQMHVVGFNAAGEIPFIGLGYRLELGVFIPDQQTLTIIKPEIPMDPTPPGEYDYDGDGEPGGPRPEVLPSTPFAKWTLGLDYSFGPNVMINVQWVHGLVDEFGAGDFFGGEWVVREGGTNAELIAAEEGAPNLLDCAVGGDEQRCAVEVLRPRIADYLVVGADFRFLRQAALVRLFTLFDLGGYRMTTWDESTQQRTTTFHHPFTPEGFSAVVYPEFQYNFGGGFELHVGALLQFGKDYSKFGDPAAGGHQVYARARYSF
ncbi:MAG TPA: hypothetical protein DIU15_07275 [Deltaproteobacteria bacterium]|nr:hypothetical protein [Deltaproteobacteria bacterium]HCP45825.1 hypothetical protein [Deltaproteobacteria bacterium]